MKNFPIKVPADTLNAINHGPYQFNNMHAYTVMFQSDPELVASLVPEPLIANKNGNMGLVVAQYFGGVETPQETFAGYNEIVLGVNAKYRHADGTEVKGLYMVSLWLADREPQSVAEPTILGLMVPGYPKRVCHWQEFVQGNEKHIRIGRRGADAMSLRITDAPLVPVPMPPMTGASFVLKYIPSAVDERCADVLKLNQLNGSTQMTSMAQVQVRFDNNEIRLDSGVVLPVKQVNMSTRCMMDMLPLGNVELLDYLKR
jgi:acetoacetate decarboxylase